MKTEQAKPLLARFGVVIPREERASADDKDSDGSKRPTSTMHTLVARETTDDN